MLSGMLRPQKGTAISSVKCVPGRASGNVEKQPQVISRGLGDSLLSKCIKYARLSFLQLESLLGFRLCFGLGDPFWLSLALYWIRNIYSSPDPPFLSWRYVIHLLFYKESEIEVIALSVR